jgi:pseudaminic acid synthase
MTNFEKCRNENRTYIVAELSANHGHSLDTALKTVKAAADSGADAIKIQTYTADTITLNCDNEYFQIKQGTIWDGTTLYKLYQEAYTPWEWHIPIQQEAEKYGLDFFSTPFDSSAVDFLESINVPVYKIASFEINDIPLLKKVAATKKPLIISTGIATMADIEEALITCRKEGCTDITLLKCTSSYPALPEKANLATIPNMKETFGVDVGLSDHTMGIAVALAATALGARIIEKHFIIDKSIGGPDASFSMEPEEFRVMVRDIRTVEKSIGTVSYELDESALKNKEFSRSLFVSSGIAKGEIFTESNIKSVRPFYGLHTRYFESVLGRRAREDITAGTPLSWNLVE